MGTAACGWSLKSYQATENIKVHSHSSFRMIILCSLYYWISQTVSDSVQYCSVTSSGKLEITVWSRPSGLPLVGTSVRRALLARFLCSPLHWLRCFYITFRRSERWWDAWCHLLCHACCDERYNQTLSVHPDCSLSLSFQLPLAKLPALPVQTKPTKLSRSQPGK